jgi:FkbH-like protein
MTGPGPRKEIDELIAAGAYQDAFHSLRALWSSEAKSATAGFVVSRFEALRNHLGLQPHRLAILRSLTVEPVVDLLRAGAFSFGIDLTVHVGGFNVYVQEILDAEGPLYRFEPDTIILALQSRDLAPDLWLSYSSLSREERLAAVQRVTADFQAWVRAIRDHTQAHLILHTLEQPTASSGGITDAQTVENQASAFHEINRNLVGMVQDLRGVYLLDYDGLVARHGRLAWHDERKWLTMRLPISSNCLVHLSQEWLRYVVPLTGKIAKAVILDLDNTLWGGVIGEDGMEGIQLGSEFPGAAYQALQRVLLDFYQRGILLGICSKNNPEEAMEVLRNHPGMVLRPEHFAAVRINWSDKADNLREIAEELNIGTAALAFLDDNPAERQRVSAEMPEVTVVEIPSDPMGRAAAVRDNPIFQRLRISEEDRQRATYYAAQRQRADFERTAYSKDDYFRALRQEVEVAPADSATLSRVAQLTQKTNQFNLTTRRYSEQQIEEMIKDPDWRVLSLRVRDRFGDNGLVGVAITHQTGEVCEIDTFLLSCRVIGRTVETALLAYLTREARERGAQKIQGWFLPTKKNLPAREFYPQHNFQAEVTNGKGTLWALALAKHDVQPPSWIQLTTPGENKWA